MELCLDIPYDVCRIQEEEEEEKTMLDSVSLVGLLTADNESNRMGK